MTGIPTKKDVLAWIADNPGQTSKRDIAKAFGVKGAARIDLKQLLKSLEAEGHLARKRRTYRDPDRLPPVSVLEILPPTPEGDLFAKPLEWHGEGSAPVVLFLPREADPALGPGDRILARLTSVEADAHAYEARLMRRIGTTQRRLLGIFRKTAEGGRIQPIDKSNDREWKVAPGATGGAKDGELVEAESAGPKARLGLPSARVLVRLGDASAPRAVSLIAIHAHGIPDAFPDAVTAEADSRTPAPLGQREDLRDMPLVTIDPADARDHDDAVYAHPDTAADNPGGHVVWVAIADVAHYVPPGSQLDREARKRGNSTYFPDRVVPMLPERLSADLCSLHEGLQRPCIAVRMRLTADGEKLDHRFTRAMMCSAASLTYEEVQSAMDGAPSARAAGLMEQVIAPLYAAFEAALTARARRQPLELDLPERRIGLSSDGRVTSVAFRERLDAHRLIEEFMVLANVCAAETLSAARVPLLYRTHEEPAPEKLDSLRETAQAAGLTLAKGQVLQTRHLNRLLEQAADHDDAEIINLATLRSMTQAYYGTESIGHFGLALRKYAHFTSPIRRYADLVVHRGLITAHNWADGNQGLPDGQTEDAIARLEETGKHISDTERRSMQAERDTTDRYLAAYLSERVGSEMSGRVTGVTRFGLFVRLDETGADGLVPIRSLGREFFHFDAKAQTLMGSDSGMTIGLGQHALVRLSEAAPITGGVALELLELDGNALARGPSGATRRGRGGRGGRGPKPRGKSKPPGKRKVVRTRRK